MSDAALPRYDEVVPGHTSGGVARGTTDAYTPLPSAPPHPQQGQNQPSILRSSSPPAYWLQRLREVSSNHTVAPSAPAWGDHLPSIREEQRAAPQTYHNLGIFIASMIYCILIV